ncbi:hypothetical protein BLGI_293 [Brevibacillus laterosporus GI-9]|nr:hypothetical protein BLGI_293 [Brevibacillus laterosporus GI-9]
MFLLCKNNDFVFCELVTMLFTDQIIVIFSIRYCFLLD